MQRTYRAALGRDTEDQIATLRHELRGSEARLVELRNDAERAKSLHETGVIPASRGRDGDRRARSARGHALGAVERDRAVARPSARDRRRPPALRRGRRSGSGRRVASIACVWSSCRSSERGSKPPPTSRPCLAPGQRRDAIRERSARAGRSARRRHGVAGDFARRAVRRGGRAGVHLRGLPLAPGGHAARRLGARAGRCRRHRALPAVRIAPVARRRRWPWCVARAP